MEAGGEGGPIGGYRAVYANELGYFGVTIYVYRLKYWPNPREAVDNGEGIREARMIDGRWAVVGYTPPERRPQLLSTEVQVFDETTGIMYIVKGQDRNMLGSNVGPAIGIARSLYRTPAR